MFYTKKREALDEGIALFLFGTKNCRSSAQQQALNITFLKKFFCKISNHVFAYCAGELNLLPIWFEKCPIWCEEMSNFTWKVATSTWEWYIRDAFSWNSNFVCVRWAIKECVLKERKKRLQRRKSHLIKFKAWELEQIKFFCSGLLVISGVPYLGQLFDKRKLEKIETQIMLKIAMEIRDLLLYICQAKPETICGKISAK